MIRGDRVAHALFTQASALVQSHGITSDADLGPLVEHPPAGIDPAVLRQLRYMYEAGAWVLLESAIADLPTDLRWLFESGAVTLEQLAAMHEALGVTSATDLIAEIRRHSIRSVPGLDEAAETAVAEALPTLRAAVARIPIGRALAIADPVVARLREAATVEWVEPVGSLRRGQELIGDIELLAPAADPQPVFDDVLKLGEIGSVLHRGPSRLYVLIDRVQIGVRCPAPASAGAALLQLTGSMAHVDKLVARAEGLGMTLGPKGLSRPGGEAAPIARTEHEIYEALGMQWVPPEIRDGENEIDMAAAGTLPALLTRDAIRGDLHMHTSWSDGRDTIALMVETCAALGYEYIAITDHSQRAAASRTLTVDGVKKQAEEIASVRERFPSMTILHGCEVDILADGRLDFTDRILERFDIVLASLHERLANGPEELLHRYETAMRHPLVSIITHPTNRLLPHRAGYELDWPRFFAAAVETGTIVEIDGAPAHLDMNGTLARQAIAAGVAVSVDSDCHRAEMLERQMSLGITMARRGWVEAKHVVNTRPIADIRAIIAAKRKG